MEVAIQMKEPIMKPAVVGSQTLLRYQLCLDNFHCRRFFFFFSFAELSVYCSLRLGSRTQYLSRERSGARQSMRGSLMLSSFMVVLGGKSKVFFQFCFALTEGNFLAWGSSELVLIFWCRTYRYENSCSDQKPCSKVFLQGLVLKHH